MAVVPDSHAGRSVHEPPEVNWLVRLNLILHQHFVVVQERDTAPDLAGMLPIGGGKVGYGERPRGRGPEANDSRVGRRSRRMRLV